MLKEGKNERRRDVRMSDRKFTLSKRELLEHFWKNHDVDGSMDSNKAILDAKLKRAREQRGEKPRDEDLNVLKSKNRVIKEGE